jgi:hypothetical protein
LVVMMHSTLGVEPPPGQDSWMHARVAFRQAVSACPTSSSSLGLFLARVIDRDWRTYFDRKVVHFVYLLRAVGDDPVRLQGAGLMFHHGLFASRSFYARPSSSRSAPSGSYICCRFSLWRPSSHAACPSSSSGCSPQRSNRADRDRLDRDRRVRGALRLFLYRLCAGGAFLPDRRNRTGAALVRRWRAWRLGLDQRILCISGLADRPFISLSLGLLGAAAVVAVSALMAKSHMFSALRYLGKNSIVVYLAFFLGMAASRAVLLKTVIVPDLGTSRCSSPHRASPARSRCSGRCATRRLSFLFARPAWARLPGQARNTRCSPPSSAEPIRRPADYRA